MNDIRTVTTKHSIWQFNLTEKMYLRSARSPDMPPHPEIAYIDRWEPYDEIEELGDQLVVHRPVPWGTGARRITGIIESDTHAVVLEARALEELQHALIVGDDERVRHDTSSAPSTPEGSALVTPTLPWTRGASIPRPCSR